MKRETGDANKEVLDAILEATHRAWAEADELADIHDPYDDYNPGLPAHPFLPAGYRRSAKGGKPWAPSTA